MVVASSVNGSGGESQEALDRTLIEIFRSNAPFTGHDFFRSMTARVADALGANLVYISELMPSQGWARVVAAHPSVELEGLAYMITDEASPATPEDGKTPGALTQDAGCTYVTAPIMSRSQDLIGLFTIVHDATLTRTEFAAGLLAQLTPQVSAQLEKLQRDREVIGNEARLRQLFEQSKDILFYYLTREQRFEFVSPAVETLTGYPPEAFYANPRLPAQIIRADDFARLAGLAASNSQEPARVKISTASGGVACLELTWNAVRDDEGKVFAICGEAHDYSRAAQVIEALQLSERYKADLLESSPDSVLRLDAAGIVLDYVPGDFALALSPGQDIVGRSIRQLLPASLASPLAELVCQVLETTRPREAEFELVAHGQGRTLEARVYPVDSDEAVCRLRDVTSMRWHESETEWGHVREALDPKVERARVNPYQLTYRELAILRLVAEGQTDKQIARSLGISIYTVNKHVGNVLGKMDASSRTEAGVRALREGLVG